METADGEELTAKIRQRYLDDRGVGVLFAGLLGVGLALLPAVAYAQDGNGGALEIFAVVVVVLGIPMLVVVIWVVGLIVREIRKSRAARRGTLILALGLALVLLGRSGCGDSGSNHSDTTGRGARAALPRGKQAEPEAVGLTLPTQKTCGKCHNKESPSPVTAAPTAAPTAALGPADRRDLRQEPARGRLR